MILRATSPNEPLSCCACGAPGTDFDVIDEDLLRYCPTCQEHWDGTGGPVAMVDDSPKTVFDSSGSCELMLWSRRSRLLRSLPPSQSVLLGEWGLRNHSWHGSSRNLSPGTPQACAPLKQAPG